MNTRYVVQQTKGGYMLWDTLLSRPVSTQVTTASNAASLARRWNEQDLFKQQQQAARLQQAGVK